MVKPLAKPNTEGLILDAEGLFEAMIKARKAMDENTKKSETTGAKGMDYGNDCPPAMRNKVSNEELDRIMTKPGGKRDFRSGRVGAKQKR